MEEQGLSFGAILIGWLLWIPLGFLFGIGFWGAHALVNRDTQKAMHGFKRHMDRVVDVAKKFTDKKTDQSEGNKVVDNIEVITNNTKGSRKSNKKSKARKQANGSSNTQEAQHGTQNAQS
tara:strand:+ start:3124 stop:3483 length:360 start_codon:yes stop_codon:yes gene_type:complete